MAPRGLTIAVDGVIGAGKTTTARAVAQELGYRHIDTGAFYRTVALAAMRAGIRPREEAVERFLAGLDISWVDAGGKVRMLLDGEDVSDEIRRPEVTRAVGAFADLPRVRRALIEHQRRLGRKGGVVADGRDAGTVVFPDADLKIVMTADLEERARRRFRELKKKGVSTTLRQVTADIRTRDREDSQRDYGAAHGGDTVVLDTTGMTIEQQVDRIVALAHERGA